MSPVCRRAHRVETIEVLVDRLVFKPKEQNNRLADSIETAFASGGGRASVVPLEREKTLRFNQNFACPDCHISL